MPEDVAIYTEPAEMPPVELPPVPELPSDVPAAVDATHVDGQATTEAADADATPGDGV